MQGSSKIRFEKTEICEGCTLVRQIKSSFKRKKAVSTDRALQLLRMDLFGPKRSKSLGVKKYRSVIVDDYTGCTWVVFLAHIYEALHSFRKLAKRAQNEN